MLSTSLAEVAQACGASTRIFEILQTRHSEIRDKKQVEFLMDRSKTRPLPLDGDLQQQQRHRKFDVTQFDGTLQFREVDFRYHVNDKPVLKHLSFQVESGATVALVGASGGGKSTIVSLIEGL